MTPVSSETAITWVHSPQFDDRRAAHGILTADLPDAYDCPIRYRRNEHIPAIPAMPVLLPSEERGLFLRYNLLKCRAARARSVCRRNEYVSQALACRNFLVNSNMRLAASVAFKWVDKATAMGDACDTLMRCVDRFHCERGFKFSTYATVAMIRTLRQEWGRQAKRAAPQKPLVGGAMGLPDPGRGTIEAARLADMCEQLQVALAELSEREQRILAMRFGLDGETQRTLGVVGDAFGVTRERARQIQNRAIKKLRLGMDGAQTAPEANTGPRGFRGRSLNGGEGFRGSLAVRHGVWARVTNARRAGSIPAAAVESPRRLKTGRVSRECALLNHGRHVPPFQVRAPLRVRGAQLCTPSGARTVACWELLQRIGVYVNWAYVPGAPLRLPSWPRRHRIPNTATGRLGGT